MAKLVIGRNGVVVNIVSAPATVAGDSVWSVPDAQIVNLGDVFDPKDPQIDAMDVAAFRALFRLENLMRQTIRALRASSTAANNAATAEGLPATASVPNLTLAQTRDAFRALLP